MLDGAFERVGSAFRPPGEPSSASRSPMHSNPLEEVISEKSFAAIIAVRAVAFHALAGALVARREPWTRRQFFVLTSEADAIESLLDDHGARHNRDFAQLRELVASLRGLSLAGFSLAHLEHRLESYPTALSPSEVAQAAQSVTHARSFVERALVRLLTETLREESARGIEIGARETTEPNNADVAPRRRLPRNLGQAELVDDEQKVAEIASRFLQASAMFDDRSIRRIDDPDERELWMQRFCTEERARVFEATVHNLQSAYDTWVKNTRLEADDARLAKLRGHASAALHLLEAVTHLAHFVERHESGLRNEETEQRIESIVRRSDVREVTLNHLLYWASVFVRRGSPLAEDLLPTYTDVQEIELVLPDGVYLHARPCALIAGIVNRYATPVELRIEGHKCSAASILELMIAVGSHAEARRFAFRGDVNPLRDLRTLFDAGLGERGVDTLPDSLAYLRTSL